jgi:hypothetical protein
MTDKEPMIAAARKNEMCPFCGKLPKPAAIAGIRCYTPGCPLSKIALSEKDWNNRFEQTEQRWVPVAERLPEESKMTNTTQTLSAIDSPDKTNTTIAALIEDLPNDDFLYICKSMGDYRATDIATNGLKALAAELRTVREQLRLQVGKCPNCGKMESAGVDAMNAKTDLTKSNN